MKYSPRNHQTPAVIVLTLLAASCSSKGSNSSAGTVQPAQSPDAPSEQDTPPPQSKPPENDGGDDSGTSDADDHQNPPGNLALKFNGSEFDAGLPTSYRIANGLNLPSIEETMSGAVPEGFMPGTLAVSMELRAAKAKSRLRAYGPEAIANMAEGSLPPPKKFRDLLQGNTIQQKIGELLAGTCRKLSDGSDHTSAACDLWIDANDPAIDTDDTYRIPDPSEVGDVHLYVNGLWDRFFDNYGPTDIIAAVRKIDHDVLAQLEDQYQAGDLRCLAAPAYQFTSGFRDASDGLIASFDTGIDHYLSCQSQVDDDYHHAYGLHENFFYFWDTSGRIVKMARDGSLLDFWITLGGNTINTAGTGPNQLDGQQFNGSTGVYHIRTKREADGKSKLWMTLRGENVGFGCGSFIATSIDDPNNTNNNRMYFSLKAPGHNAIGNHDDCTINDSSNGNVASDFTEICLDGDFDVLDLTACDATLKTPPADFPVVDFSIVSSGRASQLAKTVARGPDNASMELTQLPDRRSIQDPLKAIQRRLLSPGPANIANLVTQVNQTIAGSPEGQPGLIDQVKDAQCIHQKPITFDPAQQLPQAGIHPLSLHCKTQNNLVFGHVNDAWQYFAGSEQPVLNAQIVQYKDHGPFELWRLFSEASPATSWDDPNAKGSYLRLMAFPDENLQELTIFGAQADVFELSCGAQYRKYGNLIYIVGKFSEGSCSAAFADEDCLEIVGDEIYRRSPEVCQSDEYVGGFELPKVDQLTLSPKDLSLIVGQALPQDLMITTEKRGPIEPLVPEDANTASP